MIKRFYELNNFIKKQKVLIIYGPRRAGKTTLLKHFLNSTELKYRLDSGDNIKIQQVLSSQDFSSILDYASGYDLIAIDEAQEIPNIGMGLKILIDQMDELVVIATGSSSFELSQKLGEPLTGRKKTLILYPLAQMELYPLYNKYELKEKLEEFLIFGSYPEVITAKDRKEKIDILQELSESYLLKDVLTLDRIRSSRQLIELLKLISFQVGSEVSLNELASQVKIDVKTVGRYLDILEKAFVIKKLGGFSRNLRKEVVSKGKYYFLDNGIRNAVISQYNRIEDRNDTGQLFENFIIMERIKANHYKNIPVMYYFWRTYDRQEIDLVEERDGKLFAFGFKWSEKRKKKIPPDWERAYPQTEYEIINRDNYPEFIL